jgi:hypothetical protein
MAPCFFSSPLLLLLKEEGLSMDPGLFSEQPNVAWEPDRSEF